MIVPQRSRSRNCCKAAWFLALREYETFAFSIGV
jgi:hypothetical protein